MGLFWTTNDHELLRLLTNTEDIDVLSFDRVRTNVSTKRLKALNALRCCTQDSRAEPRLAVFFFKVRASKSYRAIRFFAEPPSTSSEHKLRSTETGRWVLRCRGL